MRHALVLVMLISFAPPALAGELIGTACQTFSALGGQRLVFDTDTNTTASVIHANGEVERCGTVYGVGQEDVETVQVRCGTDLSAYIEGDDAIFGDDYSSDTLTFRGAVYSRDCSKGDGAQVD